MTNFRTVLLGTMLFFGLSLPANAQNVSEDTLIATVGDTKITLGHMIAMANSLPEDEASLPLDVLFEGLIERLVQQEAISQSVTSPSKFALLQIENERRSLLASERVNQLAFAVETTQDDVIAAYDRRFANFTPAKEFNASHILLETEKAAKEVVEMLNEGADFSETAMAKSTGPTGPSGGNLGWFGPGRMLPEFEAATTALEKGAISAPVKTKYGWHVIKLNDSRQPNAPTREELQQELEEEVWREELQRQIDELVDGVQITREDVSNIDPGVLANIALIQNP